MVDARPPKKLVTSSCVFPADVYERPALLEVASPSLDCTLSGLGFPKARPVRDVSSVHLRGSKIAWRDRFRLPEGRRSRGRGCGNAATCRPQLIATQWTESREYSGH